MTNVPTIAQGAPWAWTISADATGVGQTNAPVNVAQITGVAPGLDNTNELRVSLYGKNAAPGDTPLNIDGSGRVILSSSSNLGSLNTLNTIINPVQVSDFPIGTIGDVGATGTNVTVTATLAADAAKTWYLTGFTITALQSTAVGSADVTVSGLQNTLTMEFNTSNTTLSGESIPLVVMFPTPRPASAINTAVSVSLAALGANTGKVAITIHGFKQ